MQFGRDRLIDQDRKNSETARDIGRGSVSEKMCARTRDREKEKEKEKEKERERKSEQDKFR